MCVFDANLQLKDEYTSQLDMITWTKIQIKAN